MNNDPSSLLESEFSHMQNVYGDFSKNLKKNVIMKRPTGWNKFFKKPEGSVDDNGIYAADLLIACLEQLRTLCKLEVQFKNLHGQAQQTNEMLFTSIGESMPFTLLELETEDQNEFVKDSNTINDSLLDMVEGLRVSMESLASVKKSAMTILEVVHGYILQGRDEDYIKSIREVSFESVASFLDNYEMISSALPSVQMDVANAYGVDLPEVEDKLDFYYEEELNNFVVPLRAKIIDSITDLG